MRRAMHGVIVGRPEIPEHMGLAYDVLAPVTEDPREQTTKVPDERKGEWLDQLERQSVPKDYACFFDCWKRAFEKEGCGTAELRAVSRILVGHGNPSATEVGITLHHTWGVPCVPGSALKGLLSHYVDAVYGPRKEGLAAASGGPGDGERDQYRGVIWSRSRIQRGPGRVYRAIFGAPSAEEDHPASGEEGAIQGGVVFHDALYVPGSCPGDKPFARDVLTVHHREYYTSGGESYPNDYDSPNPVGFLSVRPGARFLVALGGASEWTTFVMPLLQDALRDWGVGGKTTSGYGRLVGEVGREGEPSASKSARKAEEVWDPARADWNRGQRTLTVTHNGRKSAPLPLSDTEMPGLLKLSQSLIDRLIKQGSLREVRAVVQIEGNLVRIVRIEEHVTE